MEGNSYFDNRFRNGGLKSDYKASNSIYRSGSSAVSSAGTREVAIVLIIDTPEMFVRVSPLNQDVYYTYDLAGNILNVKCTHNKKPAYVYSNLNDISLPDFGISRSKSFLISRWDRVEKLYCLNSGKIENQTMRCPGRKESSQPRHQPGKLQHVLETRTEVSPSSRSASSWDMPQLVSDIENVMSNDCETNIRYVTMTRG